MEDILVAVKNLKQRPSWDEYFILACYLISKRSSCDRLHVGCIVTKDNRIVTTGYNGHLPGAPHDSIVREEHEQMTIHAESNAIADAAKRGVSLDGCVAYVTHIPCIACAKMLIASGIKHIIFAEHYKDDDLVPILCKSGGVHLSIFEKGSLVPIVTTV
jgi:dCMP deaminase